MFGKREGDGWKLGKNWSTKKKKNKNNQLKIKINK